MGDKKLNIAVVGASGYTGGELLRLLIGHPQVSITALISSEKSAGRTVPEVFPHLASLLPLPFEQLDANAIGRKADLIFLALPHTRSFSLVAELLLLGKPVIDLSADYRLRDPAQYKEWYQVTHPFPDLLNEAVYGLPELHREAIRKSRLIAVPGCYPTAAILQCAPLVAGGLIEPTRIIIDAKSGISGGGRSPALPYHFPEAHESIHSYKIGNHRHTPEIEQELQWVSHTHQSSQTPHTRLAPISFTPHLIPINRGILSTAYATVTPSINISNWLSVYQDYYKGERFIRLFDSTDAIDPHHVRGSNFCDIAITQNQRSGSVISVAALDNLVKGAAGQALQAMNLMMGFPEDLGLSAPGLFP